MTDYKENAVNYGVRITSILLIIALAIGSLIYYLLTKGPEDLDLGIVETTDEVPAAAPDASQIYPDEPPPLPTPPTSPPPGY